MNGVREAVITTMTPNGSATLPFVIPSVAEGSAVQSFRCNEFVIPTGEIMGLRPTTIIITVATEGNIFDRAQRSGSCCLLDRHPTRPEALFVQEQFDLPAAS